MLKRPDASWLGGQGGPGTRFLRSGISYFSSSKDFTTTQLQSHHEWPPTTITRHLLPQNLPRRLADDVDLFSIRALCNGHLSRNPAPRPQGTRGFGWNIMVNWICKLLRLVRRRVAAWQSWHSCYAEMVAAPWFQRLRLWSSRYMAGLETTKPAHVRRARKFWGWTEAIFAVEHISVHMVLPRAALSLAICYSCSLRSHWASRNPTQPWTSPGSSKLKDTEIYFLDALMSVELLGPYIANFEPSCG